MTPEYDVIVVGAGSAGAVVAARASEDPRRSVLLVEAGPDYPVLAETPFDLVNSHNNSYTAHDWGFDYQATAAGRSQAFPRGRVTGGSSAVNTTIALRGMPEDYDGWAAAGNPEWAWAKVLPAFRRLERDLDYGHEPYHGDAGPISIRRYRPEEMTGVHLAFLEAARELGYPTARTPTTRRAGAPDRTDEQARPAASLDRDRLPGAGARPAELGSGSTLTRRLIIEGGRVAGVEVETNGAVEAIRGRLVVLSAGALQSPPILLRSGVGPRKEIERLGVELVRDVPGVGENLCDHPAMAVLCRAKDPSLLDADQPMVQTILRYSSPGGHERNDLQIEAFSFSPRGGALENFAIAAVLEEVKGSGRLRLDSADPDCKPVAEQRFCEDERDVVRLAGCFRDALAFTRTKAYAPLIDQVLFPDPSRELDDATLYSMLRRLSASGFHPAARSRWARPAILWRWWTSTAGAMRSRGWPSRTRQSCRPYRGRTPT